MLVFIDDDYRFLIGSFYFSILQFLNVVMWLDRQTNPYSLKDAGSAGSDVAWSTAPGLHQSAPGYYPYDPALAAYGYVSSNNNRWTTVFIDILDYSILSLSFDYLWFALIRHAAIKSQTLKLFFPVSSFNQINWTDMCFIKHLEQLSTTETSLSVLEISLVYSRNKELIISPGLKLIIVLSNMFLVGKKDWLFLFFI